MNEKKGFPEGGTLTLMSNREWQRAVGWGTVPEGCDRHHPDNKELAEKELAHQLSLIPRSLD